MSEPTRPVVVLSCGCRLSDPEMQMTVMSKGTHCTSHIAGQYLYPPTKTAEQLAEAQQQVAALTAQLAEAQRERDDALALIDAHLEHWKGISNKLTAAQAENAALLKVVERLGGQPPTGGQ